MCFGLFLKLLDAFNDHAGFTVRPAKTEMGHLLLALA
jgi:hypothetical protein